MILDLIGKVLNVAKDAVGGVIGDKIKDVAKALGTDPEVRMAILRQETEIKGIIAKDFADARQLIREESRSEDAFVRRSRPAFLWLFYLIIVFNFAIFPLISIFEPTFTVIYPQLPTPLYTLFGVSFTGYVAGRSWDKRNKLKNGGASK